MFGVVELLAALLDFEALFSSSLVAFSFLPAFLTGVFLLFAALPFFPGELPPFDADFLPLAADLDGLTGREPARLVVLSPRSYGCRAADFLAFFAVVGLDVPDFREADRAAEGFDYSGEVSLCIFIFVAMLKYFLILLFDI